MNRQIYGCVCMAAFFNPAAIILSTMMWINRKKFLRWVSNSGSHSTLLSKGRQYKVPASAAALGIIVPSTSACQTAIMQPILMTIATTITVVVVSGWHRELMGVQ